MNIDDIKNAGLKVTNPRIKILEVFENSNTKHLNADDIYRALLLNEEEVGVATIYRVLTQFEQVGIINKLHFENTGAVFELSNSEHHDHLVCVKCGKIEEFNEPTIENCQEEIARRFNFTLTDHSLYLYGLCSSCKS